MGGQLAIVWLEVIRIAKHTGPVGASLPAIAVEQ
jgi:hypothetical protein